MANKANVPAEEQELIITSCYQACSIVECFDDKKHTEGERLKAWAYLIKTGDCWRLQGWCARNAARLIRKGIIDKEGNIL